MRPTRIRDFKMKRLLFFLGLTFVVCASYAQSQVLQLPDFKGKKAVWIVRGGLGLNGVAGSYKETQQKVWEHSDYEGSFKSNPSYDFSIGFNKSFGSHPLYWGMELGFGTRGYKSTSSWEYSGTNTVGHGTDYHGKWNTDKLICHTVKLSPFTIGYKYTFCKNMAADIHLGAYASYDIAGKLKTEARDKIVSTSIYGNRNKDVTTSNSTKIGDIDGMKNYDAGINLGIGYWFGRFNVDFTWQRGFIAIYDGGSDKVKVGKETLERGNLYTNNFQIKLGYAF